MKNISFSPPRKNTGTLWLSFVFICLCAGFVTFGAFFGVVRALLFAFGGAAFIISLQLFFTGAMRQYRYTVEEGCFRVYAVLGRRIKRVFDIDMRLALALTKGEKQKSANKKFGKPYKIFNFCKSASRKCRASLIYTISNTVYTVRFDTDDVFYNELKESFSL